MPYTIEAATQYGIGGGVNGTGKRQKISGFFLINPSGRRVDSFTGKNAEEKAKARADYCNEHFPNNH